MMILRLNTILLLALFLSCGTKNQKDTGYIEKETGDQDEYYYKALNLERLKLTKDSFSLRLWITYTSLIDSGKIINLKFNNGEWKCEFMAYRFDKGFSEAKSPKLIGKTYLNGSPKSDWKTFIHQLNNIEIYKLDDINRKEYYGLCMDANYIKIEVVRSNTYSEFIFPCWDAIRNNGDVNKVIEALKLLENEFRFPIFPLLMGKPSN